MIIYLAGKSQKLENIDVIVNSPIKNWGLLWSYKELQTKDKQGSKQFKELMKRIKTKK